MNEAAISPTTRKRALTNFFTDESEHVANTPEEVRTRISPEDKSS